MKDIIASLSPLERKIIPFLGSKIDKIKEKTSLDETSLLRGMRFLESKRIILINKSSQKMIELGVNGVYYKKNHLPERQLLNILEKHPQILLNDAKEKSKLSENEFNAALGALKKKMFISLDNSKVLLKANKSEITKKMPEEHLIEVLPKSQSSLSDEERYALDLLKNRKNIIEIKEENTLEYSLTELGKNLKESNLESDLIEELTPEIIKDGTKGREFRHYNITASVPALNGGKRHIVNQVKDYAKRIWLDLGFKEMQGPIIDSSFWVFDALFTAQDHPVRDLQDTFYIKKSLNSRETFGGSRTDFNVRDIKNQSPTRIENKKLMAEVKKAHEQGVSESKGWNYNWSSTEAEKLVLRTHTTSLSARTLSSLKPSDLPAKYFAIGKNFRNETIDWSHGIEFYQTEGIVIDNSLNFTHLLGYLKEFYNKMGFKKIRFRPSFFPYTEPSVEIDVYHEKKGAWLELGGAGMFRPEVTTPLLGKPITVLAWGQGLDRMILDAYNINDLRELYANYFTDLRNKPLWTK